MKQITEIKIESKEDYFIVKYGDRIMSQGTKKDCEKDIKRILKFIRKNPETKI